MAVAAATASSMIADALLPVAVGDPGHPRNGLQRRLPRRVGAEVKRSDRHSRSAAVGFARRLQHRHDHRGARSQVGPAVALREIGRGANVRAPAGQVLGLPRGSLTQDQERPASELGVVGAGVVEHVERPLRQGARVLWRPHRGGVLGGDDRRLRGPGRIAGEHSFAQMERDRGLRGVRGTCEGFPHAPVQARPSGPADLLDQGLADERVREREASRDA